MRAQTFQRMASKFSQILGRNTGVTVTFGGQLAYTDGRRVNLPAFPAGTTLSTHQTILFKGYLDHETAHVRFTDFRAYESIVPKGERNEVLQNILNIVEDVRIENQQIEEYPGSKKYLDELCHVADKKVRDRFAKTQEQWADRIMCLMCREAFKYRGVDIMKGAGDMRDIPALTPIVDLMKAEMPKMRHTRDAVEVARKIYALLPQEANWQSSASLSDFLPQALEEMVKAAMEGKETFSLPGLGEAGKNIPVPKALKDAAERFKADYDRTGNIQDLVQDVKDQNAKEAGDQKSNDPAQKEKRQGNRYRQSWGEMILPPVSTQYDKIFVYGQENLNQFQREKANLDEEIKATKKMVNIYLRAVDRKAYSRGLEEGTLDEEELYSIRLGNTHIYKELRQRRMVNTAVSVMVDLSTSMNESLVRQAAIISAEALNGVPKLKLGIFGFSTNYGSSRSPSIGMNGQSGAGRRQGLDIMKFKEFDESYHSCRARLGGIETISYTPLGEGYAYAFESLVDRPEERRIIWIITDGTPCLQLEDARHSEFLLMERIHKKAKRYHIETIGLGIDDADELKPYVDFFTEINSSTELPGTMLKLLKEMNKQ